LPGSDEYTLKVPLMTGEKKNTSSRRSEDALHKGLDAFYHLLNILPENGWQCLWAITTFSIEEIMP
jgi:hypothetical protein